MNKIIIEVVEGVEGSSLSVGNKKGGERVAGSKPWGGGTVIHSFECNADELINAIKINAYKESESKMKYRRGFCIECQINSIEHERTYYCLECRKIKLD